MRFMICSILISITLFGLKIDLPNYIQSGYRIKRVPFGQLDQINWTKVWCLSRIQLLLWIKNPLLPKKRNYVENTHLLNN